MRPLTEKQTKFVEGVVAGLRPSDAYRRAGFTVLNDGVARANAATLMKTPKIAEAIVRERNKSEGRCNERIRAVSEISEIGVQEIIASTTSIGEITQDWVRLMLRRNLERGMQAEPVLDAEGKPIGEYRYNGAVVNGAAKLLGENLGMFTRGVNVKAVVAAVGIGSGQRQETFDVDIQPYAESIARLLTGAVGRPAGNGVPADNTPQPVDTAQADGQAGGIPTISCP